MNRVVLLVISLALLGGLAVARTEVAPAAAFPLPPARAVGVKTDTLLIGGYADGRFADAVQALSSDLSAGEAELLGEHLDRLYGSRFGDSGLTRPGRLRIAYERTRRPDGETRSIRVLGAEVATGGRLHTLLQFDDGSREGYYDPDGVALGEDQWQSPLAVVRISSPFGRTRMHPILRRVLPHTGVDLAAARGTEVRAPADGIVSSAGSRGGYGLMVELQHPNGYGTRYAHLDRIAPGVGNGGIVREGELLGWVGMTGQATGPHLHYELRRRGLPIDPMALSARMAMGSNVMGSPVWRVQRRELMELLGQTPTVISGQTR